MSLTVAAVTYDFLGAPLYITLHTQNNARSPIPGEVRERLPWEGTRGILASQAAYPVISQINLPEDGSLPSGLHAPSPSASQRPAQGEGSQAPSRSCSPSSQNLTNAPLFPAEVNCCRWEGSLG